MVSAARATEPDSDHDDGLRERGDAERHQADLDRADADRAGLQRVVDAVGGVVAVRDQVCDSSASRLRSSGCDLAAVVGGDARAGVLGVEHRVADQLADMLVLEAVVDRGARPAGANQPGHPQLGQVLRDGRRRLADELGEFVDGQFAVDQRPQHLDAGGVGQHPEHLDDQTRRGRRRCGHDPHYLHSYVDNR